MGRSSNKYEKIVDHAFVEEKITILWVIHHHRITPTSIDTITEASALVDSIFFTIVFWRFKTTRIADLNLLDSCSYLAYLDSFLIDFHELVRKFSGAFSFCSCIRQKSGVISQRQRGPSSS